MAGAVAGAPLGCTACGCLARISSSPALNPKSSSSGHSSSPSLFLSCTDGTKRALSPSGLSFATRSWNNFTALPLRNYRASLLLPLSLCSSSKSPISLPRLSSAGLAVGVYGEFVMDLRTPAVWRKNRRTSGRNVRSMSGSSELVMEESIKLKNSQNAVVVYSKSWCPYCGMVKGLFKDLGVSIKLVELDQLVDEVDVQDALLRLTGQGTVPNVFIGGKHIGGCDDTMDLHDRGELIPALEAAGLKINQA